MGKLEDIDVLAYLPSPLKGLMQGFRAELSHGLRCIIVNLDLVTKEEYLVQKRLLDDALAEVRALKEKLNGP